MAKCKRSAARALDWLVAEGADVAAVVASEPDEFTRDEQRVDLVAERHGLPLVSDEELYGDAARGRRPRDLVPVLEADPRAAPVARPHRLPELPPGAAARHARRGRLQRRGARGHERVGRLVPLRRRRASTPATWSRWSASRSTRTPRPPSRVDLESQERLYGLFQRVMRRALAGEELPRAPQGPGRYVNREEFESLRRVRPGDDLDRKLRAFWYPPYPGARDRGGRPRAHARGRAPACGGGPALPRRRDVRALTSVHDDLRLLRNRESGRRALLHELRGGARAALPQLRHARARRGPLLHELRRARSTGLRARRRRTAAPDAPRSAGGAPPGDGAVRRPVGLHRLRGAAWTRRQVKSLVDRALLRLGHEVERYGGTVDKYIGDNVMAIFGAPVAHEDDAERAVRAGLGMQDAMEEINAGCRRRPLRAARGREHGRGARGRRGRRVHGRGRHRERGLAAPERGAARAA